MRFKAEVSPRDVETGGPLPEDVPVGLRVRLLSLGCEGEVVEAGGERVKVRVGEVVIDARRAELRLAVGPGVAEAPGGRVVSHPASGFAGAAAAPFTRGELKLIGKTADEGLEALDKFLDAALLAGHHEVRIVHGHGTGRLRRA